MLVTCKEWCRIHKRDPPFKGHPGFHTYHESTDKRTYRSIIFQKILNQNKYKMTAIFLAQSRSINYKILHVNVLKFLNGGGLCWDG